MSDSLIDFDSPKGGTVLLPSPSVTIILGDNPFDVAERNAFAEDDPFEAVLRKTQETPPVQSRVIKETPKTVESFAFEPAKLRRSISSIGFGLKENKPKLASCKTGSAPSLNDSHCLNPSLCRGIGDDFLDDSFVPVWDDSINLTDDKIEERNSILEEARNLSKVLRNISLRGSESESDEPDNLCDVRPPWAKGLSGSSESELDVDGLPKLNIYPLNESLSKKELEEGTADIINRYRKARASLELNKSETIVTTREEVQSGKKDVKPLAETIVDRINNMKEIPVNGIRPKKPTGGVIGKGPLKAIVPLQSMTKPSKTTHHSLSNMEKIAGVLSPVEKTSCSTSAFPGRPVASSTPTRSRIEEPRGRSSLKSSKRSTSAPRTPSGQYGIAESLKKLSSSKPVPVARPRSAPSPVRRGALSPITSPQSRLPALSSRLPIKPQKKTLRFHSSFDKENRFTT